jgi:hypothetical protein
LTPVDHGSQSPFISGAKRNITGRSGRDRRHVRTARMAR